MIFSFFEAGNSNRDVGDRSLHFDGTKMQLVDVRLDEALVVSELAYVAGPVHAVSITDTTPATDPGREVTP